MTTVIDGTSGTSIAGAGTVVGNLAVGGALTVTGAASAASLQVGGVATNLYPLVLGTAITLTNQTAPDFTSIPSWAKRITLMISGLRTNGTGLMLVQIGSGSYTTSGYAAVSWDGTAATNTSGFPLNRGSSVPTAVQSGTLVLTNVNSNIWVSTSTFGRTDTANMTVGSGSISLGGVLDRIRLYVNGTQQFDAGSVNIMWE